MTYSFRPTAFSALTVRLARFCAQTGGLMAAVTWCNPVVAQPVLPDVTPMAHPITQHQRLTEWLRASASSVQNSYPLATAWSTPEEARQQALLQTALFDSLAQALIHPSDNPWWQWMQTQPATGRVPLSAVTVEWLEANPQRDPVLHAGDVITTQPRVAHVLVLQGDGQGCRAHHQAQAYPADYLSACPPLAHAVDEPLWLVQPNGRVQVISVATWMPMVQPQLAPHAILWAGWPRSVFKPGVSDAERARLNADTARWLAQRTDGLAAWVNTWKAAAPAVEVTVKQGGTSWSGLEGGRFDPEPSASNWGVVGLMQNPSARMRQAGSLGLNYQRAWPYSRINVMLQPLDWLEAGFRYTDVANRRYGPESFSGSQSLKDKSFEVKARLWKESAYLPQVAVGVRDLGGTGLFGSEYLVASKRWGRIDYSLGMAWGYMGGRQDLPNPLSSLSGRFDERQNEVGLGGTVSTQAFFRGRTALFGGVEYQSPWGPVFKLEYEGNHYQREPQGNNLLQKNPINMGLVYRVMPGLDLSVGRERGTTWTVGLTMYTDLSRLSMPKLADQPTPAVSLQRPTTPPRWDKTRQDIQKLTQWRVEQIQQQGDQLVLDVTQSNTPYHTPRVDKAMAVLHRDAPPEVSQIELRHRALGDVLVVDRVSRDAWVQPYGQPARSTEPATALRHSYPDAYSLPALPKPDGHLPESERLADSTGGLLANPSELYSLTPGVHLRHHLGGPDGFVLYQLSLKLNGKVNLPAGVQLQGSLNAGVVNNYDRFKNSGSSELPRVRTYLREYATQSRVTLPSLYLGRTARLATNWSSAVYAGYLEEMFAGVGGEVLYRRPGSRWAAGVDLNQVRQREFSQNLALRDYQAKTGHASLYWQTPWHDINMVLSAGQYLAQDRGVTLGVSRTFRNGVTMGAFATKTNVSAAQFGEGSFNKGVYWSIPLDAMMPSSSRQVATFHWVPLTRDGGAMLNRPLQLMGGTSLLDPRQYTQKPAPRPDDERLPDDRDR